MPLRAFKDQTGVRWEVWEAHPRLVERRSLDDRRRTPRPAEDRRHEERRAALTVPVEEEGWLVFHSERERRRQRPIPAGWDGLADAELEALMDHARPSGPRSRVTE